MAHNARHLPYYPAVREMPSSERPRERLEQLGVSALQTAELLAVIIGSGVHGENVVALSARLLREFGGLNGLLAADLHVLMSQHGVGRARAMQLLAAFELGRRATMLGAQQRPRIATPADAASLLMGELTHLRQEQVRILCLNAKNQVVHQEVIYQGTASGCTLRPAEVFRPAVIRTCPAILIVHNHPSGDPTPSEDDIETTRELCRAGEVLDIELVDHLIVGDYQYVSLRERNQGFDWAD
jgi:DNA repair protein RadC